MATNSSDDPGGEAQPPATKPIVTWIAVGFLAAAVIAALSSAVHTYRSLHPRRVEVVSARPPAYELPQPTGSEDAGLKVEACLGDCIAPEFDWLAECAAAWPDKLRTEFLAYQSSEGQRFCADHGEELACVFLNGKNRFILGEGDSRREVHFCGPPGDEYQMQDLVEVLRMQMEEAYGEAPADFAQRTAGSVPSSVSQAQQ
jgi:hypothetical protein